MASQSMVKVCVFKRSGRKCYEAQWVDPVTGKKKTRSTGENKKKAAERVAGKIEAELRDGRFKDPSRTTWAEFRERYESEVVSGQARKTGDAAATAFNAFERVIGPKLLLAVDAEQVSRFTVDMRQSGVSNATVRAYLRHLKAALRWGRRMGMIDSVPEIEMPKRTADEMKGRPIAAEEYERMLAVTPGTLEFDRFRGNKKPGNPNSALAKSWRHLLTGLWWSGLRIGEAMELHWTDDRNLCVDFSGRRPMFLIQGHAHKSGKAVVLPMAPEFAEFLMQTPEADRAGFVFNPQSRQNNPRIRNGRLRMDTVSAIICDVGKAAHVKVAENNQGKLKHASAHDLRRAFGFRWSMRVMPPVLQQLMRHESITTTMEYYVGRNAEAAADVIWDSIANTSANKGEKSQPALNPQIDAIPLVPQT